MREVDDAVWLRTFIASVPSLYLQTAHLLQDICWQHIYFQIPMVDVFGQVINTLIYLPLPLGNYSMAEGPPHALKLGPMEHTPL